MSKVRLHIAHVGCYLLSPASPNCRERANRCNKYSELRRDETKKARHAANLARRETPRPEANVGHETELGAVGRSVRD